jgi:hypothetical protein
MYDSKKKRGNTKFKIPLVKKKTFALFCKRDLMFSKIPSSNTKKFAQHVFAYNCIIKGLVDKVFICLLLIL